ncbi:Uu.00g095150.m01.CDS01 [Anthostomella pinea]|uniref:Uu.00g095150.m01.CDS01 n=1 Tax=Anthostomella pinea TaxID=933095 RepID=A0AAI8VT14_9PEZI|nr:Uu.00g095150.m01.CDS01 [Anthostomella pinea]
MTAAQIRSLPIQELYSRWGTGYDQGRVNNMQGLDDTELETLLPKFVSMLAQSHDSSAAPLRVIDFGCGTGRNTLKLIAMIPGAEIIGLDATPALLEVAERRCKEASATLPDNLRPKGLSFHVYNPLEDKTGGKPPVEGQAQGLISTLVIEHLPLADFFKMCSQIVAPGRAEGAKWGFDLVEVQDGIPKDPNMSLYLSNRRCNSLKQEFQITTLKVYNLCDGSQVSSSTLP